MAITRDDKEQLVAEYIELLQNANGMVVTEYRGMKMNAFHDIRRALRELGGDYVVTRNRLLKIALTNVGMPTADDLLDGPVAVAFAHDNLPAVVKKMLDKAKDYDLLVLKGAVIGASVLGESDLKTLSELPTLDELRAQILGMLVQPARNLLAVLGAPAQQLVGVLDAGSNSLVNVLAAYAAKEGDAA